MKKESKKKPRLFKTAWFTRAARKERISDKERCEALQEVMSGQAVTLGNGVYKKRLNKNMHRSIILAKGGKHWVYQYLFAKNDRENIDDNELEYFRELAKGYAGLTDEQVNKLVKDKEFTEVVYEEKDKL